MDVGCSQWGFATSTMTPHRNIIQAPPNSIFPKILALDGKKLITGGLKININTHLLSYSIICAKLLYLSKMSRKYLVRHLSNFRPGQTVTRSAQNQLT